MDKSCWFDKIFRINVFPSIQSNIEVGNTIKLSLLLADEFNQPYSKMLTNLMLYFRIYVAKVCRDQTNDENTDYCYYRTIRVKYDSRNIRMDIPVPFILGWYQLTIDCNPFTNIVHFDSNDESVYILPYSSAIFQVVSAESSEKSNSMFLIYRNIHFSDKKIQIKEEYGISIGSNIYDSSILLIDVLSRIYPGWLCRVKKAVELGAGTGLLGIFLSHYVTDVTLTDKSVQLNQILENIQLNSLSDRTINAMQLDWGCQEHIDEFKCRNDGQKVDLIVAADVMYDLSAVDFLMKTIEAIAEPNHTVVLIAQKMREDSKELTYLRSENGILYFDLYHCVQIEQLCRRANVIIWRFLISR